ncbi:hypothetical protein [Paraburkholderia sp. DGU8]|uniref:hypothetical protein n=1 Tax=Paraburkholderia sp. DGU8 TaxID=3161997 RepID=UPI003466A71F
MSSAHGRTYGSSLIALEPQAPGSSTTVEASRSAIIPQKPATTACAVMFRTASSQACWATMYELVPGRHLSGVSRRATMAEE